MLIEMFGQRLRTPVQYSDITAGVAPNLKDNSERVKVLHFLRSHCRLFLPLCVRSPCSEERMAW